MGIARQSRSGTEPDDGRNRDDDERPSLVRLIDHHRSGDPGYGRPPAEFLLASSLGQLIAELARITDLPPAIFGTIGTTGQAAGTSGWIGFVPSISGFGVVDRYRTLRAIPPYLVLTADGGRGRRARGGQWDSAS